MRKLNDAIDRFCALHPNLAIPNLMKYVVGANAVLLILGMFGNLSFLALDIRQVLHGEIWRLVTYVLLPPSTDFLAVISLIFYYWLGQTLEQMWGSTKFTFYYVSGMLLTAVGTLLAYCINGISIPVWGATYVNMAMFFAYAISFPDAMVLLLFIPIKMKWLAIIEAVFFGANVLRALLAGLFGVALMPLVALLNLFIFFSPDFHQRADRVAYRARPQAVQFRKAVREQQKQKGYHHKCDVCGRTDTDYPDLQFRYCSKCAGYHCFCEDHIYNHTHCTS